ncbi:DUF4236 domain-containing protein [Pseudoneobacillus sp. C159]
MGLRFRKSFKVAPGIRMSVGKSGVGMSFGGKGLRYSVHTSGRRTATAGIPGTGLSYSTSSRSRSYKTSAYQRKSQLEKLQREQQKLQEQEYAKLQVELYENRIEQIRSIHQECDEMIDWQEVFYREEPFKQNEIGPNQQQASQELQNYKPGLLDKIFKRIEKKRHALIDQVYIAKQKDQADWTEWHDMHLMAKRVLEKDIDAYFIVIDEFRPLDDLLEFGNSFEFGTDDGNEIHVSFDIDATKVIPETALSLTKTGKLSEKALTKTVYFDLLQDYVCSCALRIAKDMFALLPVQDVYVHAFENRLNSSTGHEEKVAILSVKYDLPTVNRLNLDQLDPSDALINFPHAMTFKKTKGFEQVEILGE